MSALAERPLIESSYMYSHLGMTCLRSACGMCALCERESWRICHGVGSEYMYCICLECYRRLPHPRLSFLVSVVRSSYFRHNAGKLNYYRTRKKSSLAFAACRLNVIGLLA